MEKNTLLDFVLGAADPRATREFQQVLAEDGMKDKLVNLFKKKQSFDTTPYGLDPKQTKEFQKMVKVAEKNPKEKKELLDLKPEELRRLLQVQRDPAHRIDFDMTLSTENMSIPPEANAISDVVNKIYDEHKLLFDSEKDIFFDPETLELVYHGDRDVAKQLLEALKIKPDEIKNILERKEQKVYKYAIPIEALGYRENDKDDVQKVLNAWLSDHEHTNQYAYIGKEKNIDDRWKLLFTGTISDLRSILKNFVDTGKRVEEIINTIDPDPKKGFRRK